LISSGGGELFFRRASPPLAGYGPVSVIPFLKKKGKYEYCFDSILLNYWLSTIVDF